MGASVQSTPGAGERLKELLVARFGSLRCAHVYAVISFRGRLFLRCSDCGAETEGFTVYTPLRGGQ